MPPFTPTSQPNCSDRLRPVTWRIWLAWVLVAALHPVLSSVLATAFGKKISRDAEYPTLIFIGLLAIMIFAVLAPPIMQGLVLRRIMPKFGVGFWFLCILLSGIVWLVLMQSPLHDAGFQTQYAIRRALARRLPGTLNAAQFLQLPWGPFLLATFATSTLTSLIPAWMLGVASGMRRATLLFLVAAIAGACVSGIVEQIYLMTVDNRPIRDWALNGMSWTQRFQILTVRGGVGAVWGATTAIIVLLMIRPFSNATAAPSLALHNAGDFKWMLIAPLLIALLAPLAGYLVGPNGAVAGAPDLRKALSLAPPRDSAQGEAILAYSHNIAISVGHTPSAVIAPDGQTAIVRAADHTLVQVDLATGRGLQPLAGALGRTERHSIAWSPNGRYLALRSNGADVAVPGTPYRRNQNRVRLYLLPDLKLAGEFSGGETACLDTYAREPMLFSRDSSSLWMACGQSGAPKPDDVIAIRLDLTMKPLDIRRYGAAAANGQIGGLDRIGDSVWTWQFGPRGEAFRLHDLTHDREIVVVAMPTLLIGSLTAQTGQFQIDDQTIRLNFCGVPPGAPVDARPASWICRTLTFDTPTGALIGSVDQADHRVPNPTIAMPKQTLLGHGLRIESFWRNDSKTGELVVRDSVTGRERQRITSIAQRPLQISADGRWLLTSGIDGGDLRLYRVQP